MMSPALDYLQSSLLLCPLPSLAKFFPRVSNGFFSRYLLTMNHHLAICSRHGLAVGAKTIAIPYLFMALTAPLSYPISRLLDLILGEEIGCVYNREQLMEYIRITREYNRLEDNEVGIISGALALKSKVAGDILTPIEEVFSLPVETKLNYR